MQISLTQTIRRADPDRRADDGSRRVTLTPQAILIERQVAGVKMRVHVPVSAYGSLMIARPLAAPLGYALVLSHRDPDLSIIVDTATDRATLSERLADWAWFFGKPAGPRPCASDRRRRTSRRPKFLVRRRCGRIAPMPVVHRGEDELISYE